MLCSSLSINCPQSIPLSRDTCLNLWESKNLAGVLVCKKMRTLHSFSLEHITTDVYKGSILESNDLQQMSRVQARMKMTFGLRPTIPNLQDAILRSMNKRILSFNVYQAPNPTIIGLQAAILRSVNKRIDTRPSLL